MPGMTERRLLTVGHVLRVRPALALVLLLGSH